MSPFPLLLLLLLPPPFNELERGEEAKTIKITMVLLYDAL